MQPGVAAVSGAVPTGPVEFSLWWLRRLLARHAAWGEYVLFGSTVMYLHGLRDEETVGDIDLFVTRRVWGAVLAEGPEVAEVLTPRVGDPPFLEIATVLPIHLFYEWTARDASWITAEECLERAEVLPVTDVGRLPFGFRGWRAIPLELVRQHKRLANTQEPPEVRAKHVRDLELIDRALAS